MARRPGVFAQRHALVEGPQHPIEAHENPLLALRFSFEGGIARAADVGTHHKPFQDVADARGISPQQAVLAWELSLAEVMIPIPGASRPSSILDSAGAGEIELTDEEVGALAAILDS